MSHSTLLGWLALDTRVEVDLSSKGEKKKIKVTEWQCDHSWRGSRGKAEGRNISCSMGSAAGLTAGGQILRKSSPRIGTASSIRRVQIKFSPLAAHSIVLAWRIPGTGKPGRLRSMGLHRVRYDWSDSAAAAAALAEHLLCTRHYPWDTGHWAKTDPGVATFNSPWELKLRNYT